MVRSKIDKFVNQEIEKEDEKNDMDSDEDDEPRTTKSLNLYKEVFSIVIGQNMEALECVQTLYLYWENPWGNIVTLQIQSTVH